LIAAWAQNQKRAYHRIPLNYLIVDLEFFQRTTFLSQATQVTNSEPGFSAPLLKEPKPRNIMCTDCGLSRMELASECGRACQFITPDFGVREQAAHGVQRDLSDADQRFFGPHLAMYRAALRAPAAGAQWAGLTTRLTQKLLKTGAVDAVLTMGPDPDDRWKPQPIIVTDPAAMTQARGMMTQARGMRMGFAPLLALLEPAVAAGHRKIAVIGIPCQVYALRAIEARLGLEKLYVIGTPCSDNTTTENFHMFLSRLSDAPETISYLEFRADYHVELQFDDGSKREIPFLKLPLSDLPSDFFPLTCKTCVDYTNALADITMGYMAGRGEQWLIVRNVRGREMLEGLGDEVSLGPVGTSGKRAGAVAGFMGNIKLAAGELPLRRMPNRLRGIMGWLMPRIGPKGAEFARAHVEMKAIETVLHLRRERPDNLKHMVPDHIWPLVEPYGLTPTDNEWRKPAKYIHSMRISRRASVKSCRQLFNSKF
jgi:coenzyme F420 hydrogenase subunit beta